MFTFDNSVAANRPYQLIDVTDIVPIKIMELVPRIINVEHMLREVYSKGTTVAPDYITKCILIFKIYFVQPS